MDISSLPLAANAAIFGLAALCVWLAGSRLAAYADEISSRTGLGQALMGFLLLAGITSLPEIATSLTAAGIGDAPLAVNNLLGSISMQVAVLAIADAIYGKNALTSVVPDSTVILQGVLNICLLCLVAVAAIVGDISFGGAGAWTWCLLLAAGYSLYMIVEGDQRKPWVINTDYFDPVAQAKQSTEYVDVSHTRLALKTTLAALTILLAGSVVAVTGNSLADQTGLGSSFVGYALVAIATSLPEASTVFASLSRGLYTMAISDILGTNILNVALLFLVDLVATSGAIMSSAGIFAAVAALIGAFVTGLFVMGLAERRDRTIFKMGVDSAVVLITYLGSLGLLYTLKGSG